MAEYWPDLPFSPLICMHSKLIELLPISFIPVSIASVLESFVNEKWGDMLLDLEHCGIGISLSLKEFFENVVLTSSLSPKTVCFLAKQRREHARTFAGLKLFAYITA